MQNTALVIFALAGILFGGLLGYVVGDVSGRRSAEKECAADIQAFRVVVDDQLKTIRSIEAQVDTIVAAFSVPIK